MGCLRIRSKIISGSGNIALALLCFLEFKFSKKEVVCQLKQTYNSKTAFTAYLDFLTSVNLTHAKVYFFAKFTGVQTKQSKRYSRAFFDRAQEYYLGFLIFLYFSVVPPFWALEYGFMFIRKHFTGKLSKRTEIYIK